MSKKNLQLLPGALALLAVLLISGCGSGTGIGGGRGTPAGSLVTFGTDSPICDVESLSATITAASLVPQSGGQSVQLITGTSPVTIDFARLADFTNILNNSSSVPPGTYNQLQVSLTNPQLIVLNTLTSPPTAATVPATLSATTFTLTISPALVVTANTTSGLTFDLNLGKSVQVSDTGAVTGTISPQITVTPTTPSGSTVGEATALYGIAGAPVTTGLPTGFTGSFPLALQDGTGQILTILSNSSTVFEGDGVTSLANLTANTFVEVDATVDTSGNIIAQTVDAEEQTSAANQKSAFLGKVVAIARDSSGNATSFTLLVDEEVPDLSGTVPLHSGLNVALVSTTNYFTNLRPWNRQAFTLGPRTLGVAERLAVFGTLGTGSNPTLTASQVFIRPRSVAGNLKNLSVVGSDNKTGGFTLTPCGDLFAGHAITVVTYADTTFTGVSGLNTLTTAPTLNTTGLLFYQPNSGGASTGVTWPAQSMVLQARRVHQLPN
jgi:hypothetical protein